MKFKHNFLLVDIEATGLDLNHHEIIQLAAIELDKNTLAEVKRFNTFVKPTNWDNRDPEAMEVNQITWEQLQDSPDLKTALTNFSQEFSQEVTPTNYGGNLDFNLLKVSYERLGLDYPFDYHVFNLWPLCYTYMASQNLLTNEAKFTGFSLDDTIAHFGINSPQNRHDALTDCELEAEVMRNIFSQLNFS
ncbi:MAG: 3'-5' exonuclease [Candidatus Doudnabacteria bacterium]